MKDRIRKIMESQHMTQQEFANFIGTNPATLSGIFNDRTHPSLSIVEMIKKKFPSLNTDWLVFGDGDMFSQPRPEAAPSPAPVGPRQAAPPSVGQRQSVPTSAVASQPMEPMIDFGAGTPLPASPEVPAATYYNPVRGMRGEAVREDVKIFDKPQRRVTEIRVYYDDQTWESFVPSKK